MKIYDWPKLSDGASKQIQYSVYDNCASKNCSLTIIPNADIILPKIETSISSPNINIEKINITSSKEIWVLLGHLCYVLHSFKVT